MGNEIKDAVSVKKFTDKVKVVLKKYLVTGLIVIIPLWLTYFVLRVMFNWISAFTAPYLMPILSYFMSDKLWMYWLAKTISFFASIAIICVLGFFTNKVLGKTALTYFEKLIEKLPLLGSIYSAAKQVVNFVFSNDSNKSFKKVVFVPYPHKGVYSIAFLTGEQAVNGEKYVCAFMPTTPNPTTGFLFLFKEDEIVHTDYSVEDAFQLIMSVGVVSMDKDKNRAAALIGADAKDGVRRDSK
ncbi:MAG: DUF502 domain-containing protein [Endomicrobium sp.]|jgi:uncharacterized membrane protein|nr:DUF502 domain-containing protein [Endomicrobium sp.]